MKSLFYPELIPFEGVGITHIESRPEKEEWDQNRTRVWERWAKNIMVLTDSPYIYIQLLIHVNLTAHGARNDPLNPFQWSHANRNLPGEKYYTPELPWVVKVKSDGNFQVRSLSTWMTVTS